MTRTLPLALLRAGSCLGAVLGLIWLGREGLGWVIAGAVGAFLALLGVLLVVQHPQAVGNAVDAFLCAAETRGRALARGWQSYRIGYQAEVKTPMLTLAQRRPQAIRPGVPTEAK